MAAYPWMPLYVADYLADTLGLTTEEHGAYDLLIFAYWRRGGPLPDDNKYLAHVAKANRQRWAHLRKSVEAYFQIHDGAWHHKRIDTELLKATGRYNSARANGRAGGLAKSKLTTTTTITTEEESKTISVDSKKSTVRLIKNALNGHKEDFQAFYDAFPKHVARRDAEKAYSSALSRASPSNILDGAFRYAVQRSGEDPKYTQAPGPWLRADRWLDETARMAPKIDPLIAKRDALEAKDER